MWSQKFPYKLGRFYECVWEEELFHPPIQEIWTSQKFSRYFKVKNQLTRTVCVLSHLNTSSVISVSKLDIYHDSIYTMEMGKCYNWADPAVKHLLVCTENSLLTPLYSPREAVQLKGKKTFCILCKVSLCNSIVHRQTAFCYLIYWTQPKRKHHEVDWQQGDDTSLIAAQIYDRSFYLSSTQFPLRYNKSNLDH